MKALLRLTLCASLILSVFSVSAQESKDTTSAGQDLKQAGKSTGKAVGKAAKAVGNKTAEVGVKGVAKIKDKSLKNAKGPNGETVYVDKYDKKYYVDKKGKKIYL